LRRHVFWPLSANFTIDRPHPVEKNQALDASAPLRVGEVHTTHAQCFGAALFASDMPDNVDELASQQSGSNLAYSHG
jgi:hypothetical protein